jgi:hypothetical protein
MKINRNFPMKIKRKMSYHQGIRTVIIQKPKNNKVHKDMEKWKFLCITSGNANYYNYYAKEGGESKKPLRIELPYEQGIF